MPIKKPKRCGRGPAGCRAMPRVCIDSMPRYFMPPCPILHPNFAHHPYRLSNTASSSSQSDCEEYCTVDNCSNAPMCINTHPQFCPYGRFRPEERPQQHERVRALSRDLPYFFSENFKSRTAAPSFNPQSFSSPLASRAPNFDGTIEDQRFKESRYPPNFDKTSVQRVVPFDLQRSARSPIREVLPQFTNVSYGPRDADPLLVQEESYTAHSDPKTNRKSSASIAHSTADDSRTDNDHNLINFGQQRRGNSSIHREYSIEGRNLSSKPATSESRRCCENQSCLYSAKYDEGVDEILYSGQKGEVQDIPMPTYHYRGSKDTYDHTLAGPSRILSRSLANRSPIEDPNFLQSTAQESLPNVPKCSCRYPPAFKHLSCTGNISGSCECDATQIQD